MPNHVTNQFDLIPNVFAFHYQHRYCQINALHTTLRKTEEVQILFLDQMHNHQHTSTVSPLSLANIFIFCLIVAGQCSQ